MTDDELIAFYENNASLHNGLGLDRLIELARIGASVMPRPIEEAPVGEDDQHYPCLVFVDSWGEAFHHYEKDRWYWIAGGPHEYVEMEIDNPTHFIPLSALPKPQVTT